MSHPCPFPSCTRNPRNCTPSSVVNETNSRQRGFIARGLPPPPPLVPPYRYRCSTSSISKRNASFTTWCHRTFDRKMWVLVINWRVNGCTQKTVDSRRRCLEPAASWNATRRPDPLTASQKLLLRVTTPQVPSNPGTIVRSRGLRAPLRFTVVFARGHKSLLP